MSIIVIVNFSVKKESLEELTKYLKEILPDTRSFEGCQGVELYENVEDPTKLTIRAKWASQDAQKKYMAWRMETGAMNKLVSMLSESVNMQYYNIIDE